MSRIPQHLREASDDLREERRVEAPPPREEAPREEALERAAKELGVTYEELRSACEY
jgi:hypothetical protein